jgi:hypothetical protein
VKWDRGAPEDGELRLVRPYAMTAGRTRARSGHLAIEALVVAVESEEAPDLRYEAREIMAMCVSPVSLAEIAGRLRVPLGTARVLVGDLVADGLVRVHQREADDESRPDVRLLERVLDGLSAL